MVCLPPRSVAPSCRSGLRLTLAVLVVLGWGVVSAGSSAAADGAAAERPVRIRVTWGGGKPRAWSGSIRLVSADGGESGGGELRWQTLCTGADAAATAHSRGDTIFVHEPSRRGSDGVEIELAQWRAARIAVRLWADGDERAVTTFDASVGDLLVDSRQQTLDRDGNRLTLKAAPGDGLRVEFVGTSAPPGDGRKPSTLFRPGETVRVAVDPLLPRRSAGAGAVELRLRLKATPEGEPLVVRSVPLAETAAAIDDAVEPSLQRYERVSFDIPLPDREGACDIELEAVERGGLRWSRPLASRTVQLVAVADSPETVAAAAGAGDEWKLIHELDPGSPRLHERLRRLPGVGMPHVPMPALPMPSMSLPAVTMPNVPLPNVPIPNVPLPNVSMPKLPSVSAMVPRFSGLLAAGHSTVEAHAFGPMLRLPPARSSDEPSWEGIVIAGVQPGLPHLVEVEYPLDQRAVVGMVVLEPDATGKTVESRAGGGFEVRAPADATEGPKPATLGRHAFVFWPTTRNPLLLIANPSPAAAALFGRVRVSAGPLRPPAMMRAAAGQRLTAAGRGRRIHGYLPAPDFTRFGATQRPAQGSGRPISDWSTYLSGVTHEAEWLVAQGSAGAMVVVYGEGSAIWPSELTRSAPRWDGGSAADAGLDPAGKDILGLLCRVHAREGLRLVPALSFDAPLPALETILADGGTAATGVVCVGRDGRSRQVAGGGGSHYNLLDPRVQQAVEDLVRELAGRLRGAEAVDGLALVLPHDGWMHLPGTAWGLDDVTFARFLAETGGQEPATGGERFARRAALVEGPLRDRWLDWRADVVARFQSRLAAAVVETDRRWSLHVVPTTLFAAGDLAARFRPSLADQPADADVLREIGLDPARITADGRIIFVSPHVHAATDSLADRSSVDDANRSLAIARGVAGAARRGVIVVERPRPLSVANVVPQGPFGGAAAAVDEVPIHPLADGMTRARPVAESLVAADVETVFDMGLLLGRVEPAFARCVQAFTALPDGPLELVDSLAAPLVVRSRRDQGLTVVSIANAGPTACRAGLTLAGSPEAVVDAVDGTRLPLEPSGGVAVPLQSWEVRTLLLDGNTAVQAARVEYGADVRVAIETRLADLRRRRAVLETPRPLDVLDNPGFELAGPGAATEAGDPSPGGGVGGWELVEASRGAVTFVAGVDGAAGRGIAFASANGLSTLRSNPFPPPATGRVSVAVWLRIGDGDPQPPLRLAIEGMQDGREYYRFAPVGGLAGGKSLTGGWSQFVLQIDDLPPRGLESVRVRFDLLGPGAVQIDGVRVFDLAFDEMQRVQLSRRLSVMEQRLAANDLGACLLALDTHWPRFLATFVSDDAVAASRQDAVRGPMSQVGTPPAPAERSGGMFDRVRRWWQ